MPIAAEVRTRNVLVLRAAVAGSTLFLAPCGNRLYRLLMDLFQLFFTAIVATVTRPVSVSITAGITGRTVAIPTQRRAGVDLRRHTKLRQRSRYVKMRRMAHRQRMHLPRRHQPAQNFTDFAPRRQRRQEQLHLFHAGRNHSLQKDGSQYRNRRNLRCRRSLGNRLLEPPPQKLPLCSLARRRNHGNNPQLLPQLRNGAQHSHLGHALAENRFQFGDIRLALLKALVGLNGKRRNLTRSRQLRNPAPVTVATERIHIRKHPRRHNIIRLLARLAQQVQSNRHVIQLKPHQKLLSQRNLLRSWRRTSLPRYRFHKRRRKRRGRLLSRQKETQARLFNPRPGILQSKSPNSILAHPFGARCFQLLRCQRRTSFPRLAFSPGSPAPWGWSTAFR